MPVTNAKPIRTMAGEPDNNLVLRNMVLVDHNLIRFAISIYGCKPFPEGAAGQSGSVSVTLRSCRNLNSFPSFVAAWSRAPVAQRPRLVWWFRRSLINCCATGSERLNQTTRE
jgi:hypothetical protein